MNPTKNYQFYHIYPLGFLGKLEGDEERQLQEIHHFIPHLKSMHINALYIGPVFESVHHGYDTVDYRIVDSRIGTNDQLRALVKSCHEAGIEVMLDCVFNHVSRSHGAFQDVLNHQQASQFRDWFHIDFGQNNHRQDGFAYEGWAGHDDLVKLNLGNDSVKTYLIETALYWMEAFDIDGLRLDAADVMDRGFIRDLVQTCREVKPDFYVFGEMVHGDYKAIIEETGMDGVTNYECYKGLYSSLNDANYYEIAYAFNRLFGDNGLLKGHRIYNFVDNHDVNRVASTVEDQRHLYPLYLMMYTMPGYPSLYYGSEFAMRGERDRWTDKALRPSFSVDGCDVNHPLYQVIQKLSGIRNTHQTLAYGAYEQVWIDHQMMGYVRKGDNNNMLILLNSQEHDQSIEATQLHQWMDQYQLRGYDLLAEQSIHGCMSDGNLTLFGNWGRIIV